MLIGKYTNTLDTKGRVFVPAAFRSDLGERFVLTRGSEEKSLYIYPMEEWENFVKKLQQLPTSKKNSRAIIRHFCANATNCAMDSQGRILIPQELRDKAELQKEVVFIGTVNKIEVWSAENVKTVETEEIDELLEALDIDF
ncbi:MAG: division/cell wall cluster transcriptional repressor MraZ [Clostridiaceae bacterium]|mgnify:FL=1|nr:division/cell wall cluster transcriptional repressor MraZ [Clostridiaceae bacterium]